MYVPEISMTDERIMKQESKRWKRLDNKIADRFNDVMIVGFKHEDIVIFRQTVFDVVLKKLKKYKYSVSDLFVKTKVDEYVLWDDICKLLNTKK